MLNNAQIENINQAGANLENTGKSMINRSKSGFSDNMIDRFKKSNLYYANDPYMLYQDPTYLGFKFFFHFDQPDSGLLSSVEDTNDVNYTNTAIQYLLRNSEIERASYLKRFIEMLKGINSKTPWFFQSIDGISDLWKRGFNESDFSPLIKSDKKLTINCLESIDLRITALMDLYRKSCFDWINRREIIPQNLRYFKVKLYIYEAKIINGSGTPKVNDLTNLINNAIKSKEINQKSQIQNEKLIGKDDSENDVGTSSSSGNEYINNNISRVMFDLNFCEFLPDESSTLFDSVSNTDLKMASQKITFNYRNVTEDNLYTIWGGNKKVSDLVTLLADTSALDKPETKGILSKLYDMAKSNIANIAGEKGLSFVNKTMLGNMYGLSANELIDISNNFENNPIEYSNKILGKASGIPSLQNNSKSITNKLNIAIGSSLTNVTKSIKPNTNVGTDSPSLNNNTKSL